MRSTREIFNKVKRNPTSENYQLFYKEMNKKMNNLSPQDRMFLPSPENFSSNYIENLSQLGIEGYFGRPYEIKAHNQESEDLIFYEGNPVFSLRRRNKLIVYNPSLNKLQSWYNLTFANTSKHIDGRATGSQFNKGNRKECELTAFNEGMGYFDERTYGNSHCFRIFMINEFPNYIGRSAGEKTPFIKLQADRVRSQKGYKTLIHGYPITEQEYIIEKRKFKN